MLEIQTIKKNPILNSDFPDPDVIRVGDTYYMASTTMHFMPGCDILRSYDLVNWEFLNQVYDKLEETPPYCLDGEENVYGEGMWAPTFRYHDGYFYLLFTANDTHKTYLFRAEDASGPWERVSIRGFYYDSSLFFDDDGKVYIVHGHKILHLTELAPDLSGPAKGGLDRVIAEDEDRIHLGFEGSHMYKRNGKYYVFTCHMLTYGSERKSQVCFVSDSLTGKFEGRCIIDDDMGFHNLGVAQGGIVDTPEGVWYAFMFQDRGALGRAPVLMPVNFENDFPVLGDHGKVPEVVTGAVSTRPEHIYEPINGDDSFIYEANKNGKVRMKRFWQFNHVPDEKLWSVTERSGAFRLHSGKICKNIMQARNTLTQRMTGPDCAAEVTVDAGTIKNGDFTGICAFQGCYGLIGVTRERDQYYLVMLGRPAKNETIYGDFEYTKAPVEYERIPIDTAVVRLRLEVDFTDKKDEAAFFFRQNGKWQQIGIVQKLYFKMDHFTGCRFGLFFYSTEQTGGISDFLDFRYYDTKVRLEG